MILRVMVNGNLQHYYIIYWLDACIKRLRCLACQIKFAIKKKKFATTILEHCGLNQHYYWWQHFCFSIARHPRTYFYHKAALYSGDKS